MRKLAIASGGFCAAIFLAYYLPPPILAVVCLTAAASLLLCLRFIKRLRTRIYIIIVAGALGLIWSFTYTTVFITPLAALDGQTAEIEAVVLTYPEKRNYSYFVELQVKDMSLPGKTPHKTRLYCSFEPEITPGDIVKLSARLSIPAETAGDTVYAYLNGELNITGGDTLRGIKYFPRHIAAHISEMLGRLFPEDVSPLMQALLVGDREKISADAAFNSALSASGLSHVLSVSGMHLTFLMGFLSFFVKNKRIFAAVSIPVLFVFMALTGFSLTVVRAGIMQLFVVGAPLFHREADGITSLMAALLFMLAKNPYSCASAGLQLSFAATLGILLLTGRLGDFVTDSLAETRAYENKTARRAIRLVTGSLATTLGASVFTLPLTAAHFGQISLAAPLSNLVTLWAVSLTFTGGIIASAAGFIFFPAGRIAAFAVSLPARFVTGAVHTFASIPFAAVYVSSTAVVIWLVYVYAMFAALPAARVRARQYLIPVCLSVMGLCAVILTIFLPAGMADSMTVTVLNVGQGQSVAITSDDYTAIVDCGGNLFDGAGAVAHEYLTGRGKLSLDLLILTHFHSDHTNGVEYLLGRTFVTALAIPDPDGSDTAEDIIDLARRRGTDIIYVTETLSITLGEAELVIYPPLGDENENERGLSVLALGKNLRALVTGDMDSAGERRLLRFADLPDIDLLIAGHHGSKHSTSEELLRAVKPELCIISSGDNNYGHPAPETLAILDSFGVAVMRTDESGSITVGSPGAQTGMEETYYD